MKKLNEYNASSIDVLKGLEPVRKNPSMYIGNTDVEGLHHLVYELIDNSVDEYLAGYCTDIKVTIHKDSLTVEDNGRGIPVDEHKEEKISALELVMTRLHAGGKFKKNVYSVSGGLHGLGASIVNALAEYCRVEVRRDGKVYYQEYKRGEKTNEVQVIGRTKDTGTKTTFKPDSEIFNKIKFDAEIINERLKERAYLNSKLHLHLIDENTSKKFDYFIDGGIKQFVKDMNFSQEVIHDKVIYFDGKSKEFEFEAAFQYTRRYSDKILSFANNINTVNGGVHVNAFKNALLKAIEEFIEKNKLLKGLSLRIMPRDVIEGITAVISVKIMHPQFEGQTKTKLNNIDLRVEAEEICKNELSKLFKDNEALSNSIINRIVETVKARDAAAKARELIKRKSGFDSLGLPTKLTDCASKERDKCELYLVEGDSAGGSAKVGRNKDFQAILPLRGKVLNVENEEINNILENNEIKNVISTLGINIATGNTSAEGLRYGKIIIMADADIDGQHIAVLLLTLFYRHMKKIIEDGHVFIARPPLYRIVHGNKIRYFDTDEEMDDFKKKHQNITVQRFKGLGEMNAEQLYDTTMDMDNRKLDQMIIVDDVRTETLIAMLMGKDASLRKQFIIENAKNITIDI